MIFAIIPQLLALGVGRAKEAARTGAVKAALFAVIGLCLLTALGFLVSAAWIWVAEEESPMVASLFLAACFAVLALFILLIERIAARRARKRAQMKAAAITAETAALVGAVRSLAGGNPLIAGLATLAAGYYLSRK